MILGVIFLIMNEYHKIDTVFKRDERGKIIIGEYSRPEFEYLKDNEWVFTEKVDGTNIRIMWDGNEIKYGGKTDNAQMPVMLFAALNELFEDSKEQFLDMFGTEGNVCLYGEGYGAKIQKGGGLYSPVPKFVLFDIKIGYWWLERDNIVDIASKLGLMVVPIILTGTLGLGIELVQNNSVQSYWGNFKAEGLVAKPRVELKARNGDRIITKIKVKDFVVPTVSTKSVL